MLYLSIYTLIFKANEKSYLYNSRSNFFSEISTELYDVLANKKWSDVPVEVVDELISREIVCDAKDRYNYYYSQLLAFNARNHDTTRMGLVLAPTTACNFACPYCFESKQNPKTIGYETIESLVSFIKGHQNVKRLNITWYGGEPLLAFDKMKAIYERLSSADMPKIESQSIVTNGYLFNDEAIDFFNKNGCSQIQITIDGLYAKHSATRCLKNSKEDTFLPTVANIDKLVVALPNTRINIRVNVNKDNYKDFVAVANFFKDRYPGNNFISAYPGLIREEDEEKRSLCISSFSPSERLVLHDYLRKEGYNASDFPIKSSRGCMMHGALSYIVGPEGEIYKCWNDVGNAEAAIGNINSSELSNPSRYLNYMTQAVPFNSECKECHAFPICDGGCSYHRYRNIFEGCHFDLCSPYKNIQALITALLTGNYSI